MTDRALLMRVAEAVREADRERLEAAVTLALECIVAGSANKREVDAVLMATEHRRIDLPAIVDRIASEAVSLPVVPDDVPTTCGWCGWCQRQGPPNDVCAHPGGDWDHLTWRADVPPSVCPLRKETTR